MWVTFPSALFNLSDRGFLGRQTPNLKRGAGLYVFSLGQHAGTPNLGQALPRKMILDVPSNLVFYHSVTSGKSHGTWQP